MARNPGVETVIIEFDAQNSFGAVLRGEHVCEFLMSDMNKNEYYLTPEYQAEFHNDEQEPCCLPEKVDAQGHR
jgi:hypothetical protein